MKVYIYIFFIIITFFKAFAQNGGNAVYQFLNLNTSAKQSALGGKISTNLNNDIFQPAFNPATIDSNLVNKWGINYTNYLSDINYGNIAYAVNLKKIGVVYGAICYVNYGNFDYANESGEKNGTFGSSESALLVGYAYHLPKSNWSTGLNVKFIRSSFENYSSTGIAFDWGFLFNSPQKGIQSALVLRNFGWQISTYQGTKEKLPFEIDFTFSKTFLHAPFKWFVSLEHLQKPKIAFINTANNTQDPNGFVVEENITITDHVFRHLSLGVELFPRKRFNIRIGYNFKRAAELSLKNQRLGPGLNFGFGLRLRKFEINYAYSNYSFASNANFLSIIVNLNQL